MRFLIISVTVYFCCGRAKNKTVQCQQRILPTEFQIETGCIMYIYIKHFREKLTFLHYDINTDS